jgi:hypothetical protein
MGPNGKQIIIGNYGSFDRATAYMKEKSPIIIDAPNPGVYKALVEHLTIYFTGPKYGLDRVSAKIVAESRIHSVPRKEWAEARCKEADEVWRGGPFVSGWHGQVIQRGIQRGLDQLGVWSKNVTGNDRWFDQTYLVAESKRA